MLSTVDGLGTRRSTLETSPPGLNRIIGQVPGNLYGMVAQAELDGKFTPADRQQLQEIYRIVGKLGI